MTIVYPETLLKQRNADLEAENARLREALGWFLKDTRFVVQVGGVLTDSAGNQVILPSPRRQDK